MGSAASWTRFTVSEALNAEAGPGSWHFAEYRLAPRVVLHLVVDDRELPLGSSSFQSSNLRFQAQC